MKSSLQSGSSKEPTTKHHFGKTNPVTPKGSFAKPAPPLFDDKYLSKFGSAKATVRSGAQRKFVEDLADGNKVTPRKSWWVHVWSGLVLDGDGKHRRAMRQAVWLYLLLLLAANRRTGKLYRRVPTIMAETGFSRRSVHRWLKLLADEGYITKQSTGRSLRIEIAKWRPIVQSKEKPPPQRRPFQNP